MDLFASFYGLDSLPTFDEFKQTVKGEEAQHRDNFFNGEVYRKRIEISAEIFLSEANSRAKVKKFIASLV